MGNPSELWVRIGRTLWSIQALEYALAHYLTLTKVTPGNKEAAYSLLENSFKVTLGRLVKKLKQSISVPSEIETRLEHLTDERNWLAHRVFRLHHTDIRGHESFSNLIARIEHLGDEAISLATVMAALCRQWCIANGISEDKIDTEIARRYDKWMKT